MKKLVVDRIEGGRVVLENEEGRTAAVDSFILPEVSEGDVLEISVNYEETNMRRSAVREKMNKLWAD